MKSKGNLPLFIATRIGKGAKSRAEKAMVHIATVSVAVSIATMVLTVAIVMGFQRQISDKIVGFASHYNIVSLGGGSHLPITQNSRYIDSLQSIDYVKSVIPYIEVGGVIKSDSAVIGLVYKGVEEGYDFSFFKENLVDGSLPNIISGKKSKEVLISKRMADRLSVAVGDRVAVTFLSNGIYNDRVTISGIYSSAMDKFDSKVIIGDIENLRRLLDRVNLNKVSGYEVTIDNINKVDSHIAEVEQVVFDNTSEDEAIMVVPVTQSYMQIFDWLKLQNTNVAVIIAIMIFVSAFNIISMMLIILIDKSSMVGTLKALGMGNGDIQRVFLYRSAYILAKGIGWGLAISLILAKVQQYFKPLTLSSDGYFLNYVPIEINYLYICAIAIGSFISILLFGLIPVKIISNISPSKSIKFN